MGAREALSLQYPLTRFSHRFFAPVPLENPLTVLSTYFWLSTFKKSREQTTEYKNTWNVGFEADHEGFKAIT